MFICFKDQQLSREFETEGEAIDYGREGNEDGGFSVENDQGDTVYQEWPEQRWV